MVRKLQFTAIDYDFVWYCLDKESCNIGKSHCFRESVFDVSIYAFELHLHYFSDCVLPEICHLKHQGLNL